MHVLAIYVESAQVCARRTALLKPRFGSGKKHVRSAALSIVSDGARPASAVNDDLIIFQLYPELLRAHPLWYVRSAVAVDLRVVLIWQPPAIILYDHAATFDDECRLIWTRPRKTISVIFLVSRYIALFAVSDSATLIRCS